MTTAERIEWCKSLKVGDEVAVDRTVICKVKSITPTGRFTAGRYNFNSDGSIRGGSGWGPFWCEPVTDDIRKAVDLYSLRNWASTVKWGNLSIEQLRAIKEIAEPSK